MTPLNVDLGQNHLIKIYYHLLFQHGLLLDVGGMVQ